MIIQAGYTDSIAREICCEYATYESCLTFLRNLITNPGCGTLIPQASFIAADASHLLSGLILVSRLSAATALIAQIAVLPGYQGCRLGSALMAQALTRLRALGFTQVCLSVSEQNERAYVWYRRLGFQPRQDLLAFVWRRPGVKYMPKNKLAGLFPTLLGSARPKRRGFLFQSSVGRFPRSPIFNLLHNILDIEILKPEFPILGIITDPGFELL